MYSVRHNAAWLNGFYDFHLKFRICILSHSGLDRTLYIASLHSGRMEIRDLWNIQPIVGMYTYSDRMEIRELWGFWEICRDVPTIHEYPLNFKYPHHWNVGTLCIASAITPHGNERSDVEHTRRRANPEWWRRSGIQRKRRMKNLKICTLRNASRSTERSEGVMRFSTYFWIFSLCSVAGEL
jgi:hypothetical protein